MHGFELADLIRVNQLIRDRIDFEGFRTWYAALTSDSRRALTYLLWDFARQAGVSADTWEEALSASGLSPSDPMVQRVLAAGHGADPIVEVYQLIMDVPEEDLPMVFTLFVYLFGVAEGKVYRGETKQWCNHWWHRDLLDERVVQDLLSNPRYYRTAMKDDDRIKGHQAQGQATQGRELSTLARRRWWDRMAFWRKSSW